MEIIDLRKLNVKERLKIDTDLKRTLPKFNELNDHFLLKNQNSNETELKRELSPKKIKNLTFKSELMPEKPTLQMSVFEQAEKSWKEIENFEFKNLDVDSFYDKELKRVNRLLL